MRLQLIAIGRLKSGPERDLVDRYRKRAEVTGPSLGLGNFESIELPESRARREADRQAEEMQAILERAGSSVLTVFDERAPSLESEAFAGKIAGWRDSGTARLSFVIGGPDGLDPALRRRADWAVSFGRLTIPHQLARILAVEQIYRAMTILSGHPYHRVGQDGA